MKRRSFIKSLSALGTWMRMQFKLGAGDGWGNHSDSSPRLTISSGNRESHRIYTLETLGEALGFDVGTGQLVSFRSHTAKDQEFIAAGKEQPVFVIDYLDENREYRQLTSAQASEVKVTCDGDGAGKALTASFQRIAGLLLHVTIQVQARHTEKFSRWSLTLTNDAGIEVVNVQFPFVVCAYDLGGAARSETVVLPQGYGSGRLIRHPSSAKSAGGTPVSSRLPDDSGVWELIRGDDHYPGMHFAQFLAYHNDRSGIYLACEDTGGRIKQFKVVNRSPGLRLRVAHFGDWPKQGRRRLEYDVVLSSFNGDWYDAGELYRTWSLQQEWATPLHRRKDVPTWLLESPVYITIHPEWDIDLSKPIVIRKEFLPFEKCIPLLQEIADRVQAPVAAILMGWEKTGSWSYPNSVPWLGGEDSLKSFVSTVRQRGWHVGTFCNGSRWVFGHKSSGYDGSRFFKEHGGMESVCRTPKGDPVLESWEAGFRKSYECCLGSLLTRQIAVDYVNRMIGWGFESLQFFDQNNGAATFPCYASAHEHSPVPGKWMTEKMEEIMAEFRRAASEAGALGVAHSSESGINEYCLPLFQETEFRMWPPGHGTGDDIPLYQLLFHECIVIQGMMGWGAEPYHMQIKNAANCVWGAIAGGVLTGDGTFLNKDTPHFAPWEPKVGSNEDALEMIRTVTALRRGPGKDFLVFGRMLKPAAVKSIQMMDWTHEGRQHRVPSVFHAAWQAPNGRFGIVLANWTTEKQTVIIKDTRLPGTKTGDAVVLHTSGRALRVGPLHGEAGHRTVALAPLSCALVEVTAV